MKQLLKSLLLLACISPVLFGADAANDLLLTQRNSGNTGNVQRNITATTNTLLGWNGTTLQNITAGSNITISAGVISSSGGGGGGTPGGSSGDWQYNNAGSFGGMTPATGWNTWFTTPSFTNFNTLLTGDDVAGLAATNGYTGINTFTGRLGRVATTMATTSIDVTKAALNRSLTANETESFSATPATDMQLPVYYSTDGTPRVVTWGVTVYSYDRQADISATGISIPASGTYVVTYNYSLARTRWEISGAPVLTNGTGNFILSAGTLAITSGKTATFTNSNTWSGTDGAQYTGPTTNALLFANTTKADSMDAAFFAQDAGSTDAYAITLSPAITAYVTGVHYRFKANTANTGAATLAINGLTATTIVKVAGGITTTLANNDILAGQWVEVVYDGTNMQMQSMLGNAAGGTGDVVGPASATNTAIALFDTTTGKLIKNSVVTISAIGELAVPNTATTGVSIYNSSDQASSVLRMTHAGTTALIQSAAGTGTASTLSLLSGTTNNLLIRPGSSTNGQMTFVGTNSSTSSGVGFRVDLGTWTQSAGNNVGVQVLTVINHSGTAAQTDFQVDRATETATGSGVQRLADLRVAGVSKFAVSNKGIISYTGLTRVATQFDKTNTTLADVTGLTATVRSGETYTFRAVVRAALDGTGGGKYAIAGSATATTINYDVTTLDATAQPVVSAVQTSLGSSVSSVTAVTADKCIIEGTITVNVGGTLTVQFAQASASGTSSVLVGGTFDVKGF